VQLDQTRVAIRQRDLPEILDLGLRVLRSSGPGLIGALAVGILPVAVFNTWLLGGLVPPRLEEPPWGYLFLMSLLMIWEIPLATAPATLYLGQVMFTARPSLKQIVREFVQSLPQLLLYQCLLRGLLVPWVITWIGLFGAWPYANEVLLLERNPLQARRRGQMTTWGRCGRLHQGHLGTLLMRGLGCTAFGAVLLAAVWVALDAISAAVFYEMEYSPEDFTVLLPLAAWLVVGYFTVVRFLCYLDLRIRREGWEVELVLRAEAARLHRQLS